MASFMTPHSISAYLIHKTSTGARYLLIRRCGNFLTGTWQMLTGGVEQGETARAAALREIREETGLSPYALYAADAVETFYMHARNKIACVPVFVGFVKDTIVRLSPREHDAYEWLSFEEAREKLVWSEQKRIITHIHHCFILNQPDPLLLIENEVPVSRRPISRTGVYGIAMHDQKLLLVKQRKGPHSGKWELPGGGIEPGETIEGALRREFYEEVGMSFDNMQFFENLTATTEWIDEQGDLYRFHQVGLVYRVTGLSPSHVTSVEMEYAWIDPKQLAPETISPLVRQIIALGREPLEEVQQSTKS
jgi:dATP pyrophosphohydrolase